MKTKLDWALEMAGRGMPVFPIRPNEKLPIYYGSFNHATTDPSKIKEIWERFPDANIGVYPGVDNIIIDIDKKPGKNGIDTVFERLGETEVDYLYETFSVRTPSGGIHLYYKTDVPYKNTVGSENSEHTLLGVDTRAKGGYVLGPGSTINDVPYTIVNDAPIAKLNRRWIDYTKEIDAKEKVRDDQPIFEWDLPENINMAREFLETHPGAIEFHGGNHHTYKTACHIRDVNVSEDVCLELMRVWNIGVCEPPWSDNELQAIIKNAYRYAQGTPGERGGGMLDLLGKEQIEALVEFNKRQKLEENLKDKERLKQLKDLAIRGGKGIKKANIEREMIIPDWIPAHGITGVLAKRNLGKTVVMIDLAHRIACNMDWYEEPIEQDMTSIYICGEDLEGAIAMSRAWMTHYDIEPEENRLILSPVTVDLMSRDDTIAFMLFLLDLKEQYKITRSVVFIDTWQRATSRGAMSKDEDMQKAIHNAEDLARAIGGPVIIAFHPSKGNNDEIIGSSIIANSTTAILQLTNKDGSKTQKQLETIRVKGSKEGEKKFFEFISIDMGEHKKYPGKRITAPLATELKQSQTDFIKEKTFRQAWAHVIAESSVNYGVPINTWTGRQFFSWFIEKGNFELQEYIIQYCPDFKDVLPSANGASLTQKYFYRKDKDIETKKELFFEEPVEVEVNNKKYKVSVEPRKGQGNTDTYGFFVEKDDNGIALPGH